MTPGSTVIRWVGSGGFGGDCWNFTDGNTELPVIVHGVVAPVQLPEMGGIKARAARKQPQAQDEQISGSLAHGDLSASGGAEPGRSSLREAADCNCGPDLLQDRFFIQELKFDLYQIGELPSLPGPDRSAAHPRIAGA